MSTTITQPRAMHKLSKSRAGFFRNVLLAVVLALALAAGPLTVRAAALTAPHVVSSATHLADGNPPQLPCTGGLSGPC